MSYPRCTHRTYRIVIPDEMRTQAHRLLCKPIMMASVWTGIGNRESSVCQIDAIIREITEKDGLLAALLIDCLQIEVFSIYKDMDQCTDMKKWLVSYVDFKAGKDGD